MYILFIIKSISFFDSEAALPSKHFGAHTILSEFNTFLLQKQMGFNIYVLNGFWECFLERKSAD